MKNDHYNLFLDDSRNPSDVKWIKLPRVEWVVVRNYEEFVDTIERRGMPRRVSFDHDIYPEHYQEYTHAHDKKMPSYGKIRYDCFSEKTGYDCAKFLAQYCVDKNLPLPLYYLHTMNAIGKENMRSILESARKHIPAESKCKKCAEDI
jgi:hypothetical protein